MEERPQGGRGPAPDPSANESDEAARRPTVHAPRPPVDDAPPTDDERLYDAYLAAALGGDAPDPAAFLAGETHASEALRARLAALHEAAAHGRALRGAGDALRSRAAATPAASGLPFERLGEFRLLRRLDEGGMGAIYLAEQESLGRIVALKVLRPELRGSPTADARLEREALAIARLDHPHIVQVHAIGEDRGVRYVAMAYVEGRGLDEVVAETSSRGRRVPAADVLRWGAQIARALACAHAASIVHRDVKPSNVRITADGRAMLLDFGVARALDAPALTVTGPFVGTPLYAAPEQAGGGAVDARTDVYGLGVTLWECLAGRPPFEGRTTEEILRRVLAGDLPPLRRLAPGVTRDVETVVRKAMARDPADRYATATDLAEDLEALLAFRPIRARPPSVAKRVAHWARRRPALASVAATWAVALLAGAVIVVVQTRAADARRREDARRAVGDAVARLSEWRRAREGTAAVEEEVRRLSDLLWSEHLPDDRVARLDALEIEAANARRRREAAYYEVLDLVARAERLDPDVVGAGEIRTRLFLERWREAVAARDAGEASFYRDLVLARDASGEAAREIQGDCTVRLSVDVPDAVAWVFRYRPQREVVPGGEPRFVPVPLQDEPPVVAPGTRALVVTHGAGDLARGDLVLSLGGRDVAAIGVHDAVAQAEAGGVAASVHRDGVVSTTTLPSGLRVRFTAAPLPLAPSCRRPAFPRVEFRGEPGEYLVLLRAPGRADQRVFVDAGAGDVMDAPVTLSPEDRAPEGFVRVVRPTPDPPYWIQEREVTAAEYLRYLNDPATLAEIAASSSPVRYPRDSATDASGGLWPRGADGRFALPPHLPPDGPVVGVSQVDARAYAAWFGRRIGAAARGLVIRLPTMHEWAVAAGQSRARRFPFGQSFRPRWAKSCFSTPKPGIEPVLSYPVDESPFGAFDMAGSAREWSDERDRGLGRICGGSWALGKPEMFETWFSMFVPPDTGSPESGIRLVAVEAGAAR